MGAVLADGTRLNDAEYEEYKKQRDAREQAATDAYHAEQRKIYHDAQRLGDEAAVAYSAYVSHLKQHPHVYVTFKDDQDLHNKMYDHLRRNLKRADNTPRCGYTKVNGVPCSSPRMTDHELCYAHQRMEALRPEKFDLPPLEDANSIQIGLMHVARGLMDGKMDTKTASLMLRCLQIASSNVGYTNFGVEEE